MVDRWRKRDPLSLVDTAWLRMEIPTNLMMITGIFMFDYPLKYDKLRAIIEGRLLIYDRFKQRVIDPPQPWRTPYWEKDPDFDIRSHLHRIALPAPGNQQALQELVNDFMSMPLDFTKPLWQFHLIEGYGKGSALLCRLHHCIADGIALTRVLLNITDTVPEAPVESIIVAEETPDHRRSKQMFPRPLRSARKNYHTITRQISRQSKFVMEDPSRAIEGFKLGARSTLALANLLALPPDPPTPFKGSLGVSKRCAWSHPIPLADVKAVGKVTGGTVNDVLLTATSGALGRYMRRLGKPTGGLNIRAVVPVNLRPLAEEPKLGNNFGLVFLSLPLGFDDPLDRLTELKLRMDAIKGTPEAIVTFGILNFMGATTPEIEDIVTNIFEKKATTVITNVPGPREVRYLAGVPIKGMMFWVPQSGRLGLGVSILSYAGEVLVGIACDAGLVSDPESVIEDLHVEFDQLMELVRLAREADEQIVKSASPAGRCQGWTKSGSQCKNSVPVGAKFCYLHRQ